MQVRAFKLQIACSTCHCGVAKGAKKRKTLQEVDFFFQIFNFLVRYFF